VRKGPVHNALALMGLRT